MPYVPQQVRHDLRNGPAEAPGGLNYQLTYLVTTYMREHGLSYQTINDVVGALESAKLEFYRRIAIPYEDRKIDQNGDVYHELDSVS